MICAGWVVLIDMNDLDEDGLKAPSMTKKRGRPKEKRMVSPAEKSGKRTVKCGVCKEKGHNSRSCPRKTATVN